MENASKALLIAGAVLIAILLISMGIKIFTSAQGKENEAKPVIDSLTVSTFNNRFLRYVNERATGTETIAFINAIMANDNNGGHKIYVTYLENGTQIVGHINRKTPHEAGTTITSLQILLSKISIKSTYSIFVNTACDTVEGGYDSNGYISCMKINKIS